MSDPVNISTAAELVPFIRNIDASHGSARAIAAQAFQFIIDTKKFEMLDPFSAAYRDAVLDIFHDVHPEPYKTDEECNVFPYQTDDPFPYSSRSPRVVGTHFAAIYTILRDFPISPPGRVLDVGSGWGHTSLALARTGFEVHPFDINAGYLQLIKDWSDRLLLSSKVNTIHSTFDRIGELELQYDAILFFESFHHSINHEKMLQACITRLANGGVIVFAGEPIFDEWFLPWSIRLESDAIYCIHKLGWMELGFREDYFLGLLARCGLYAERRRYLENPIANGYVARRAEGEIHISNVALPLIHESTWNNAEPEHRWTKSVSTLPGSLLGKQFALKLANYKTYSIYIVIEADGVTIGDVELASTEEAELKCDLPSPSEEVSIWTDRCDIEGGADDIELGVAVKSIVFRGSRRAIIP